MKECTRCGEVKDSDNFRLINYTYKPKKSTSKKTGIASRCISCLKEINKEQRDKNPFYNKEYRKKNPNKSKETYKRNKTKILKSSKNKRDFLSDSYVVKMIIRRGNFKKEHITPEIIEVKREIIKINRLIKSKQS